VDRLQINHRLLSVIAIALGILLVGADMFFHMTDLSKSQLSGRYVSKILYNHDEVRRIIGEQVLIPKANETIVRTGQELKPSHLNELLKRADDALNEVLRRHQKGPIYFYQGLSTLETELRLHISFKRNATRKSAYEFDGFGIVIDKQPLGREAICAVVVASSPIGAHNHLEFLGVRDRARFLWKGEVVTIEMQQLVDPFHSFMIFRFLLKFRLKRHLSGWNFSDGVFYIWDAIGSEFVPHGYTTNISIGR
jgi:hypothetical protein